MRITSSRCRAFEYTATAPAACAVDLDAAMIGAVNCFTDCLVVSIALGQGDDWKFVGVVTRAILGAASRVGVTQVVINGDFRPPPRVGCDRPGRDVLAELADALDVVTAIVQRLSKAGVLVHLMPFGWHTDIRADIEDGRWVDAEAGPRPSMHVTG